MLQVRLITENETLATLCRLYWTVDENQKFQHTVSDLAKQLGYKSSDLPRIINENCYAYLEEDGCARCKNPFLIQNRTAYQQALRSPRGNKICAQCSTKEREDREKQLKSALDEKRRAISENYALSPQPSLDITSISFEDALYLLSFIRAMASENLAAFGPLEQIKEQLSPSLDFSLEILKQLYHNRVVA